jgi:hypothetical protein
MRLPVIALISLVIARPSRAQSVYGPGCNSPNGGTIKGVAVDDSSGAPASVRIVLADIPCAAGAGSNGVFLFKHVPPGTHTMVAQSLFNYRRGPAVKVKVFAGVISETEFRLHPPNDVLDCVEEPRCAPFLHADVHALSGLTEAERMREVGLRTAFAVFHSSGEILGRVACIVDSSAAVVRAVAARIPRAVAGSECGLNEPFGSARMGSMPYLIHRPSGQSATSYHQGRIRIIDAETFEGDVSYYMNPLGAATWECRYKKEKGTWIPKSCRMTVIS